MEAESLEIDLPSSFLQLYENRLKLIKTDISELLNKQEKMRVTQEMYTTKDNSIQEIFEQIKIYKNILCRINQKMKNIHQRTNFLKKKVFSIQSKIDKS